MRQATDPTRAGVRLLDPPRVPTFAFAALTAIADAEVRAQTGSCSCTLPRDYRQRLRAYCQPFFGDTPLSEIDARLLRRFRQWLADRRLKGSSINPIMSFASVVLKLAWDDGLIRALPPIPRCGQQDSPRPAFTEPEYRRLVAFLDGVERGRPSIVVKGRAVDWQMRAMVTFMVNSFFRPGDLFTLRHKHVEIIRSCDGPDYLRLSPPSSKGHSNPIISMPAAVPIYRRIAGAHRRVGLCDPDDFVFLPLMKRRPYAKEIVRRQFTAALTACNLKGSRAGVPHTLYSLRHTAIVFRLLNAEGLDLLTLARNCRTSVEMIDRFYASSLTPEMNRDKLHSFRRPTRHLA